MNYIKWQEYYEALNKGIYSVLPFTVTGMPEVVCTKVNPVATGAAELGKLYVVSIRLVKSEPVGVSPSAKAALSVSIETIAICIIYVRREGFEPPAKKL